MNPLPQNRLQPTKNVARKLFQKHMRALVQIVFLSIRDWSLFDKTSNSLKKIQNFSSPSAKNSSWRLFRGKWGRRRERFAWGEKTNIPVRTVQSSDTLESWVWRQMLLYAESTPVCTANHLGTANVIIITFDCNSTFFINSIFDNRLPLPSQAWQCVAMTMATTISNGQSVATRSTSIWESPISSQTAGPALLLANLWFVICLEYVFTKCLWYTFWA